MIEYFNKSIIEEAIKHAKSEYPNESCGFIINDKYIPMVNIAEDKENNFKIDSSYFIMNEKNIQAIIHSHVNYPHASKKDMIQQISTGKPWGIISLNKFKNVDHVVFWGDQLQPQDLIGRNFFHGVYDCYGLVRDYYKKQGIELRAYPRENKWWEKNPSMLEDNLNNENFIQVDMKDTKKGDLVLMQIMANVVNHSGILLNNGIIMHHLYNRLSIKEPINRWSKYISGFYRHIEVKNA